MGRPIKESKMVGGANDFGGDLSGKLAVTAYRPFGGSKVDSTVAYIVNQRGSKKFKIHLDDSSEEVMLLKAVAPGSLANNNVNGMGEFCVQVILNDSTVAYVEKFYNNTIHYVESDGTTTGTVKYTLGAEGTDEGQAGAGIGSIDVR
jgi:hypothetical protein